MNNKPTINDVYEIVNRLDLLNEAIYNVLPQTSFVSYQAYASTIERYFKESIIGAFESEGWEFPDDAEFNRMIDGVYFYAHHKVC